MQDGETSLAWQVRHHRKRFISFNALERGREACCSDILMRLKCPLEEICGWELLPHQRVLGRKRLQVEILAY
jgi:hypothetical protein